MYITVYQDPEDKTIHAYLQENKPIIPEDYQRDCNLLIFDTNVKFPNITTVVSKASMVESLGGVPEFGDDSKTATINTGIDPDFGIHLRPIYENYDL
jgi:hypothetical protein